MFRKKILIFEILIKSIITLWYESYVNIKMKSRRKLVLCLRSGNFIFLNTSYEKIMKISIMTDQI